MAVENKYVNADIVAKKKPKSVFNEGARTFTIITTEEIAAADTDASVYRMVKAIDPHLIPVDFQLYNDAITSATSYDVGLYETTFEDGVDGAVISKALFLSAEDISAGNGRTSAANALAAVDVADAGKSIMELAGHTLATKKLGYDICITANTVGSIAGTVTLVMTFAEGH